MPVTDLPTWIEEVTGAGFVWYVKRLSGNDTCANGAHQAGPYIPKDFLFEMFPTLNQPQEINPRKVFDLVVDSHADIRAVTAIWYNNKLRGGTRNEARVTNFGGAGSALLDPESTGGLTVFAFLKANAEDASICHVWVCQNPLEEDLIEEHIGAVEPGQGRKWVPDVRPGQVTTAQPARPCWLTPASIPPAWLTRFPGGATIVAKTIELHPLSGVAPDLRLVKRRECEFDVFQSIEEAVELPRIQQGFATMEEFISYANSLLQRRKARSGTSLELHLREILLEEGLRPDVDFAFRPRSEEGKRPDFLFPSEEAYHDPWFPAASLRMLAVKTTCKDRWRQILNEADRIPVKHLLTLQEGMSEAQFQEMTRANVKLVVPERIIQKYASGIRPYISTLESFIGDLRLLRPRTGTL